MPFITQDKRKIINPILDQAWDHLIIMYDHRDWDLAQAGNLAYVVYYLMLKAVDTAGKRGWGTLTRVWSDVALGAAAYFKRYEIDEYEAEKLDENGPVILHYDDPDDEIPF